MITKLKLWWRSETCFACGKKAFMHSWSNISPNEQLRRVVWGKYPERGWCTFCGIEARPLLADMSDMSIYSGQKGWVFGWWWKTTDAGGES